MEGFKRLTGMGYCTLDIPFGRLRLIWLDLGLVKMAIAGIFSGGIPNSAIE